MSMKCAIHPDRDAIGSCCSCGGFVCPECKVDIGGQIYCNPCLEIRLKTGSWPGQTSIVEPYASGMGTNSPVPPDIKGWSWGGFLLTWIWGLGNNVWISLIAILDFIPYIGWIISLTMRIILGVRGNEWAWQHKKWDSIEHFQRTQRKWMWWGIGVIVASIIFTIALIVLLISLYMIVKTMGFDKSWQDLIPWHF
ncbi:MAG: hypothetical protein ABSA18_12485 [Dehalococcoidia bacterium]|jgi:hypothetical protein